MENQTLNFKSYDLKIITNSEGNRFVAFKNAYEPDFVQAMEEAGVKETVRREED